jgi:hypothetical protein
MTPFVCRVMQETGPIPFTVSVPCGASATLFYTDVFGRVFYRCRLHHFGESASVWLISFDEFLVRAVMQS